MTDPKQPLPPLKITGVDGTPMNPGEWAVLAFLLEPVVGRALTAEQMGMFWDYVPGQGWKFDQAASDKWHSDMLKGSGSPTAEPPPARDTPSPGLVPPLPEDPDRDTGHYDDGHSFGWKDQSAGGDAGGVDHPFGWPKGAPQSDAPWAPADSHEKLSATQPFKQSGQQGMGAWAEEHAARFMGYTPDDGYFEGSKEPPAREPEGDTGHYDDGHSFGWDTTPPPPSDDDVAAGPRARTRVLVGGVLAVALLAVAAIGVVVTSGDDKEGPVAVVTDEPDEDPATTVGDGEGAVPAGGDGPIRYESLCTGAECFSVDMSTCLWTFHFELQLLDDFSELVGQTAVIETTEFGLAPSYEVLVGADGRVVLDATADTATLGATPETGCAVDGAHYTAHVTSVGGRPTFTPDPPP